MFDDIFPKQSLGATPKNEMRKTMDKVGVDGFRTQIVTLPNGDTAVYKSKNGNPEFVVQKKPVKLTPVEVLDVLYSTRYVTVGMSPVYRHTITGTLCTEVVEADKQLPRKNYWQGSAVSVPISYNGPTTGAWIVKFGFYDARSLYSEPFVAYRKIGGTVYRRELDLSNKGTIVLTEKLHPSGVQVYKYFQGYHHDTPGDLEPLVGGYPNDNRFMSLNINASGSKARCLARPTAGGSPPLHLYEYDLDNRSVTDLGVAISYSETINPATGDYTGSAEHIWATGFVGDSIAELRTITSSSQSHLVAGSPLTTETKTGAYNGSFSLVCNGAALFTIEQPASSSCVTTRTLTTPPSTYTDEGNSTCETVNFMCFLLYANLAHEVVCVKLIKARDIFVGHHVAVLIDGSTLDTYNGSMAHSWDYSSEVRVYKSGALIYSSDKWQAGTGGNNTGSDTVYSTEVDYYAGRGVVGAGYQLVGVKGGASNVNPFGYAFFIGLASGAVQKDGKQIAIAHEDLAVVLTKTSGGWVAANMPSMADNATAGGNLIQTRNLAYDYDSQVIT